MKDEEKTVGTALSAKGISKIFKFVSAAGIILCAVFKWLGFMPGATIGEIIL